MIFAVLEQFSLFAGLVYIFLQVKQNRWMWPVDILCCIATICVFAHQGLWASMGLNVYYLIMGFVGLAAWGRDEKKAEEGTLRLRRLPAGETVVWASVFLTASAILYFVLRHFGDPSPLFDALVGGSGIVGTVWLVRCYLANWWVWIFSDLISVVMCLMQGLYGLAVLYGVYLVMAFVGYVQWKRDGKYI